MTPLVVLVWASLADLGSLTCLMADWLLAAGGCMILDGCNWDRAQLGHLIFPPHGFSGLFLDVFQEQPEGKLQYVST